LSRNSSYLLNLQVHYCVHKSLPLVTTVSNTQSTTYNPVSLSSILILHFHLYLGLPSGLFPSCFTIKMLYPFLTMHATCPTHQILHLITIIIFGEAYKLQSSSLCSLLPLSPSEVQIFSSAPYSQTPSIYIFPQCLKPISYPYKTTRIIMILYILIFMFLERKPKDWTEW